MGIIKNNLALFGFVIILILIAAIFSQISGLFESKDSRGDEKVQVSVSFYPLWYFASLIGEDKANVINITPAGTEPHEYDLSTRDIAQIENGDMLILNGSMESWADKIKENLRDKKVKIVIAGEGLFTKVEDPHIWLDPKLAIKEVQKITEGFVEIDPADTSFYQDNEKGLISKLEDLDNQIILGLKNCKRKDIITSHSAFAYFAQSYGLNQKAITGFSPESQPSAQQLAEAANFAKENNVKYIFFESLVSPKLAETIANEVGAQTLVLDPIEGLSDDDIRKGKDYFTLMQDNLKNLQTALECSN